VARPEEIMSMSITNQERSEANEDTTLSSVPSNLAHAMRCSFAEEKSPLRVQSLRFTKGIDCLPERFAFEPSQIRPVEGIPTSINAHEDETRNNESFMAGAIT
jgi:hypothetical protein